MRKRMILVPTIAITLLLIIEQVLEIPYLWKTIMKILIFLAVPIFLMKMLKFNFLRPNIAAKKSTKLAFVLGILVMVTVLASFFILQNYINLDSILSDLESRVGISSAVFPFVAIYILLGNSFLEEFFFRGLLVDLYKESRIKWVLPSFLFAIYHIAIFLPWFDWPILLTAVGGLFLGGLIFQWMNEESGTIYPSWIIHIFGDVGVLLVGFYMFYF